MPLSLLAVSALISAPVLALPQEVAQEAERETSATGRPAIVLDDETGRPIVGAIVYAVHESEIPVWGRKWFRAAVVTDATGRASVPPKSEVGQYGWLMAEAKGYGTLSTSNDGGDEPAEFRLKRETPITIEVVDFLGRPLPLAHLGVCFGCGHTPDLISEVTGPNGRATLHGVTDYRGGIEDLYVMHPELLLTSYDSVPYQDVVDGVARFYGDPGCVITGCVLRSDGSPAVGYGVGDNLIHRGPWALTDERGEFRLLGCEPMVDYLSVITPGETRKTFFAGARPGVYRTLRLDGTDRPEVYVDGEEGTKLPTTVARVQISAPHPEGCEVPDRLHMVPVVVWEEATGRAFWSETDESGAVGFELQAGRYAVEVGGPASPYPATTAGRFSVEPTMESQAKESAASEPSVTVTVELPAARVCPLEILGVDAKKDVFIQTAGGYYSRYDLKGPVINVPNFLLPSGRWSAHTYTEDESKSWRRLNLAVPRQVRDSLVLSVPE